MDAVGPAGAWLVDDYASGQVAAWEVPGVYCGTSSDGSVSVYYQSTKDSSRTVAVEGFSDSVIWSHDDLVCSRNTMRGDVLLAHGSTPKGTETLEVRRIDALTGDVLSAADIAVEEPQPGVTVTPGDGEETSYVSVRHNLGVSMVAMNDDGLLWQSDLPSEILDHVNSTKRMPNCPLIGEHLVCVSADGYASVMLEAETGSITHELSEWEFPVYQVAEGLLVPQQNTSGEAKVIGFDGEEIETIDIDIEQSPYPLPHSGVHVPASQLDRNPGLIAQDGAIVGSQHLSYFQFGGESMLPIPGYEIGITAPGDVVYFLEYGPQTLKAYNSQGEVLADYSLSAQVDRLQVYNGYLVSTGEFAADVVYVPTSD
ncbi:hypothetical protein VR010_11715 [Actinomycetaceae bacterium L2_0104]